MSAGWPEVPHACSTAVQQVHASRCYQCARAYVWHVKKRHLGKQLAGMLHMHARLPASMQYSGTAVQAGAFSSPSSCVFSQGT